MSLPHTHPLSISARESGVSQVAQDSGGFATYLKASGTRCLKYASYDKYFGIAQGICSLHCGNAQKECGANVYALLLMQAREGLTGE